MYRFLLAYIHFPGLLFSSIFTQPLEQDLVLSRSNTPIVNLGYAQYAGVINTINGNTEFLGIRYAAPPTGSLRWRAPRPPPLTSGVQLANTEPSICYNIQTNYGLAPTNPYRNGTSQVTNGNASRVTTRSSQLQPSEDCLFLNIFTPHINQIKLLPVLVYIHGGGYENGNADLDGNYLIDTSSKDIIFVALQYRLGLFGFLPGKAVKQGGDLNVGLLDQRFALQWVQQHIHKFGGDPNKVTIWGTSAGAGSVLQHVIAQNGNTQPPLFRGVMTSSTFLPSQYPYDGAVPEAVYAEVASQAGCRWSSHSISLECLRSKDVELLNSINSNIAKNAFYGTYIFVPVVDGTYITERPSEALRQGKVNGEALLSFTNSNEGFVFINPNSSLDVGNYVAQLFPRFGQKEIDAAAAQYAKLGTPLEQASAVMEEAIFVCPTYLLLNGFRNRSFKGEFAVPPGYHGSDVAYYFPSYVHEIGIKALDEFGKWFTVQKPNPNIKSDPTNITPKWNKWNERFGKKEMLFNKTEAGDPLVKEIETSAGLLQRCEFWKSVGELAGQ